MRRISVFFILVHSLFRATLTKSSPLFCLANVASALESARRFNVATVTIARDSGNCERTHPLGLALSYVLVTLPRPLNHAEACKVRESDVRGRLTRQIVSPALYQPLHFHRIPPPQAIHLICFSMRQTKEIKNSPFSKPPARGSLFAKESRYTLSLSLFGEIEIYVHKLYVNSAL